MPQTFYRDEEPNHASSAAQQLAAQRQQLAESEAKFSAAFQHSSTPMSILTEGEANYLDVNPAWTALFGYSRDEAIGRSPTELGFYADPAQRLALRELLNRDGCIKSFEVKWRRKDGTIRTHLLNADRITLNEQPCLFVVSNDITERKLAEAEIKALSDYNRNVLESISDPLFTLDREWRFTYMSRQGEQVVMREPGELLGKVLWEEFPGLIGSPFENLYRQAMKEGIAGRITDFYPDHQIWYEVNIFPSPTGVTVYFRNVTENKQREGHLTFIADVLKDFAPLSSADEIMQMAGERIAEHLKLAHCAFVEINESADEAIVLYDHHEAESQSLAGNYSLAEFLDEASERRQLAAGKVIVVNDVRDEPRSPDAAARFEALDTRAFLNAPYVSDGRWKFALSVHHSRPYQWREDEIQLVQELSARIYLRLERTRAQVSLRESEERYRSLFDSIDEGFCIIEMIFDADEKPVDFVYLQANPAFAELTGLRNVVGQRVSELVPGLEPFWFETYGKVALTGEAMRFENQASPLHRWFDVHASRIGDARHRRVAAVFNNITARKQSEATLHASEVRYRSLFETAKDGILILDTATAQITNANPYIGALLGFSHAELIGKELWEIGLFKDIEESKAAVRELQAKKYIRYEDLPLETKAGRRADVEFVSNVYQENGYSVIQCNIRDITERKHAEAERERLLAEAQRLREAAETATRAKDEFLAVVSHELRNPLNSMLGYARLMRANPHEAAQVASYAEIVERNARMQQQLIEDLLDTARIISGKLKIETAPTDLRLVLADALAVVRPAAEAKQIELRAALGDEPQPLLGDAARLQQVAWNLLQNAIKFTPAQGCVEVRLEKTNDAKTGDDHLCLIVSDTGKGIEPEFLPSIFDRFTQQDMSSTRRHGGLGLGLTLAKQLVELHGGTIGVTSPGRDQGSTFTVRLPQRTSHQAASAHNSVSDTAAMNSANGRVRLDGLRLLVVDDQEEARQLLTHFLREGGALVTTAESGFAALALLEQQSLDVPAFDLLICDIAMPDMDGYEVLRCLREQNRNSHAQRLPAIALTAHTGTQDRLRALAAGFQMHVAKPVEPEELITVIASLTGRL